MTGSRSSPTVGNVGSAECGVQELVAIEDGEHAPCRRAVATIHTVFLHYRYATVQVDGGVPTRARLLSDQAEIANELRFRRIAQIENLRHPVGAPAGNARDEIRNTCLALPPRLVRVRQSIDDQAEQLRVHRIGHIEGLMIGRPRPEQVRFAGLTTRQIIARAHSYHLGAITPLDRRDVMQIDGIPWVRDIHDGSAIVLDFAAEGIQGLAPVMAHIGDPVFLAVHHLALDDRVVGRSGLEVAVAEQANVLALRCGHTASLTCGPLGPDNQSNEHAE